MSRQRDIVAEVIQLVAGCGTPVGLILGGSVAQETERPDSDVDFFAIADATGQPALPGFTVISEKNGCKVFERREERFPVHVACWTTASLDQILQDKPYMTYPLLCGRVVFDPAGIAGRYRSRIRQYFEEHPSLQRAWTQQLEELQRCKAGHVEELAFPQWSDFIRQIEEAFPEEVRASEQCCPRALDH
jgi:hypothetical protein